METQEAIMAFSQSEKIKSGLIWASQGLEICSGLSGPEKQGAERMVKTLLGMVGHEVTLAGKIAGSGPWNDIHEHMERAHTMVESGIAMEALPHLTKALSKITNIGQTSMSFLKNEGLL